MSTAFPANIESAHRVSTLLQQAESLAAAGRIARARVVFSAASEADATPGARIAFGCFLVGIECYEDALGQLWMAMNAARRTGNDHLVPVCATNLAAVYRELGDFNSASRLQQTAIRAAESRDTRHESPGWDAIALSSRAADALVAGELDLAEDLFVRSLSLEIEAGSLAGQAADWGNLGLVAGLRGETEQAGRFLIRSLRLHRRIGDLQGAGRDLLNLAHFAQQLGHRRSAIRCLKRAVCCFERARSPRFVERARIRLLEVSRIAAVLSRDPLLN